jgi:hypothetical protein
MQVRAVDHCGFGHQQDQGIGEGKRFEVHGRKLLSEVCVTKGGKVIWKGLHGG